MFSVEQEVWVDAGELTTEDVMLRLNGESLGIAEIKHSTVNTEVFNFTVAIDHTYYVGIGGVLAHNASGDGCGGSGAGDGSDRADGSQNGHESESKRYENYWSGNAPENVTPGTTRIEHTKYNQDTREYEQSTAIYDEHGRQIYRVDNTDHGRPFWKWSS